jgi:hypothetical protein
VAPPGSPSGVMEPARWSPAQRLLPPRSRATIEIAVLLFVRLSSERASQAVRQHCSFAKKQELPPALLVVVQGGSERRIKATAGECRPPG